jgi:predicted branched-subunit amino acid permease
VTQKPTFTWHGVVDGAHKGLLIAPTLIAFGLGVGLLAASKGLSVSEIALMSAWVYAGGAQMATLQVWTEPLPVFALVLTVLAMNARYICSARRCGRISARCRSGKSIRGSRSSATATGCSRCAKVNEGRRPDAGFLLGSGLVMILPWTASTVAGHLFGQILGDPRRFGIDFLLAAFFAVMSVGFLRKARSIAPLLVAIAVAVAVQKMVPGPWYLFAGALAGSLAGALRVDKA